MKNCPRLAAARCLSAVVEEGVSLSRQLEINERKVDQEQRSFYRELCYGSIRYYWRLDAALTPLMSKPLKSKDSDVKMLLIIGMYQLFYTRVADHAAINSSVEACKTLGKKWAAGMTNAILRRCQREGDKLFSSISAAATSAHPQWIYEALNQAWPEHAESILAANNGHPPFCLRVNQQQHSRQQYLQLLAEADIGAEACDFASQGVRLNKPCPVTALPLFAEGAVSVQDEAAQLCTELLALAPGQRVLDACAAPGGKTCAILETEPALEALWALDIDAERNRRVTENLQRLALTAKLITGSAEAPDEWWDGKLFDRILLDAPCSALGVVRRNPDIKLHRRAEDIPALAQLQQKILQRLWSCLRPGGILVYATCSVLPQENEEVLNAFIASSDDASTIAIDAEWGIARGPYRQLFPIDNGHDGFFYGILQKRSAT